MPQSNSYSITAVNGLANGKPEGQRSFRNRDNASAADKALARQRLDDFVKDGALHAPNEYGNSTTDEARLRMAQKLQAFDKAVEDMDTKK